MTRPESESVSAVPEESARGYYGPDGQPQFFADPAMDRFAAVLVKLAQEFWVVAERLDALERVTLAKGLATPAELAALNGDAAVSGEREAALAAFIRRTLGALSEP